MHSRKRAARSRTRAIAPISNAYSFHQWTQLAWMRRFDTARWWRSRYAPRCPDQQIAYPSDQLSLMAIGKDREILPTRSEVSSQSAAGKRAELFHPNGDARVS